MQPFNPNRGETSKGNVLMAMPPTELRQSLMSAEHYLQVMGSMVAEASSLIGKATAPVPQAYSYARISYMPDANAAGLMAWPGINPDSLRKVARENIIVRMVINLRKSDIARYSELSEEPWQPGWRITTREKEKHVSRAVRNDIRDATRFLENCSRDFSYSDARDRDANFLTPLTMYLQQTIENLYTYDGWATWTDMDRAGRVKGYASLPAGNIRLAFPGQGYKNDPAKFAALVDETGNPISSFTRDELTWSIMNPRTDPEVGGYGWSPVEQGVRLIQAFQGAIDLNADTFCYSEDTEVLTRRGWRRFDDTDWQTDEFATLNLTSGAFEYQRATDNVWRDYDGEMYHLKSRSIDLLVTPNHRVVVQYRPEYLSKGGTGYEVVQARDLYARYQGLTVSSRKNYCLPMVSKWAGTEIGDQFFECYPPQYAVSREMSRKISGDDYCAFMGMYLSEGSLAHNGGKTEDRNRLDIHQKTYSKGFEPFREVLTRILGKDVAYSEGASRFYLGWRGLARHVEQFGKVAYEKRIPSAIMNATPRQMKIFWDFYSLGDGCITQHVSRNGKRPSLQEHIATSSPVMADQLQELAQKMGYAATILTVDPAAYASSIIAGRAIVGHRPRYDVYLKTSPMQSMDMVKTTYRGKIGCVSVPNGTLYVRRGGKAAWCGNTRNGIPNGMLLLMGDYWNQDQIDLLQREWQNMKKGQSKVWTVPVLAVPEDGDVKVLPLNDLKGADVRYRDHMNMMGGGYCAVNCFPIRRLGMFASGHNVDNQPVKGESIDIEGSDDPGLPRDLMFLANNITQYLIAPNWPHLKMRFMNADPKQEAREYEARRLSRTWGESRAETDEPKLETLVSADLKPLAEVMDLCPEDPAKIGAFQSLASKFLELKMGVQPGAAGADEENGGDQKKQGSPFSSKIDPAEAEKHGHTSGVRRNTRAEKRSAGVRKADTGLEVAPA